MRMCCVDDAVHGCDKETERVGNREGYDKKSDERSDKRSDKR
mgnify:CR=1 FL=1